MIFTGTAGPDFLVGGSGDDSLQGLDGDDHLDGGPGNDSFSGGAGDDVLLAGPGNDQYSGDDGTDTLSFANSPAGVVVVKPQTSSNEIVGSASDGFGGTDWFFHGTADDLIGSEYDDVLTGSPIYTATWQEVFGQDYIVGGAGNDSISGLGGGDFLLGEAGHDTLLGGAEDDELEGGSGNDMLDGGTGEDFAWYGDAPAGVDVNLGTGLASGGDGSDTLLGVEGVLGSQFDDTLSGDAADNGFAGLEGNNFVDGASGRDFVWYGWVEGPVTANLATGQASGSWGSDTLIGIEELIGSEFFADVLVGDAADNVIEGMGGNDSLAGGDGNDKLFGEDGDDTLDGGAGDDILDGGNGADVAVFSGSIDDYLIAVGEQDGDFIVFGPDGLDVLLGIESLQFGGTGYVVEEGTEGSDALDGTELGDIIRAEAGNDDVSGGGGDDALFGEEGNDTLEGGSGNDLLDGGSGADTMRGGSGDDVYVVDSEQDLVIELEAESIGAAWRRLPLEDSIGAGVDKVVASISYTLGNFVENLTLATAAGALSGSGNALANAITGNESANRLTGGAGNDQIDGAGGIDTAVYSGTRAQYAVTLGASDQVTGSATGEGTDTLTNVERLQFSDGKLAIDLEGNAGIVAKILGAVFGPAALSDGTLAGIGLNIADTSGQSYPQLMQLALNYRLGSSASNEAVVNLLYTNVIGSAPDAGTQAHYVSWITGGGYTQASLAVLAADFMGVPAAAANGLAYL